MLRGKYTYSLLSLGIFLLEAGLLFVCLRGSVITEGDGGLWIGCTALLCFLLAIIGIHTAWLDRDLLGRTYPLPVFMMFLHAIVMIALAAIYILGLTGMTIVLDFF